jgi:alpha-glucosidase
VKKLLVVLILSIAPIALADAPATTLSSQPAVAITKLDDATRARLRLDPFYKQILDDDGLPIVASEKTRPEALLEAKYLIDHMLAHRPEIRRTMSEINVHVVVMATTEMTTDLPENRRLTPKAYWDRRARGLGGRTTSVGEENLLRSPGNPYAQENILIHEFSHCIQDKAMRRIDETFDRRVTEAYDAATRSGVWGNSYAGTNKHEYFAEGAQAWFDAGRKEKGSSANNGIGTREKLKQADPKLAALCAEVFGEGEWRYIPPEIRKEPGHLATLDRSTLQRFKFREEEPPATRPTTSPASAPTANSSTKPTRPRSGPEEP